MPKKAGVTSLTLKIGVVGAAKSGKSSFIRRFVEKAFEDAYFRPTHTVTVSRLRSSMAHHLGYRVVHLELWEIPEESVIQPLEKEILEKLQAVIILGDRSNSASWECMLKWVLEVKEASLEKDPSILIALALNKSELSEEFWKVTDEDMRQLVSSQKCEHYFNISCASDMNVDDVVRRCCFECIKLQSQKHASKTKT